MKDSIEELASDMVGSDPARSSPDAAPELRIAGDVLFRFVGGEAVILELRSGRYFGLDEVGSRIWRLLASERSTTEIADTLAAEYDTSAESVRVDLAEYLRRLADLELVTAASGGEPGARG